ncbi:substrate-binding periplasmic protein [Kiloniella laminariae]|uniref:substrate-binding periplasmic protein n=1 Tax=Kiloniella laminariae TaxID=454162 RepID=UPI000379B00A|nr:transporter substrate-binding domain-containing protein [Kiloniella laminariae]
MISIFYLFGFLILREMFFPFTRFSKPGLLRDKTDRFLIVPLLLLGAILVFVTSGEGLVSRSLAAEEANTGDGSAGMTISLLMNASTPPYIDEDHNGGAELDIVRAALALEGYRVIPRFVPGKRRNVEFRSGRYDGALTVSLNDQLEGCYSDSYITYQNVALSLKSRNYSIREITDLAGKRVVSFQTASAILEPEFSAFASGNSQYRELARRRDLLMLLFRDHADVVIGELNILNWLIKNADYPTLVDVTQPLAVHRILLPSTKYAVFTDQAVCRAFNRGIAALKNSGSYSGTFRSYGILGHDIEVLTNGE